MQKYYQGNFVNYSIIALCAALIIISSQKLFYSTQLKMNTYQSIKSVGQALNYQNTVKIKKFDRLTWTAIDNNSPLHVNDLIFTHKNSQVELSLNKSSSLKLLAETMIEVQSQNELSLGKGNIELSLTDINRPITININNTKYQLRSKDAQFNISSQKDGPKIKIKKGTVEIKNLKTAKVQQATPKKEVTLKQTQSYINDLNYQTQKEESLVNINVIFPKNKSKQITYEKMNTIYFKWNGSKKIKEYLLEIYDTDDNLLLSKNIKKHYFNWKTQYIGDVYWTLKPADRSLFIKKIPTASFTVQYQNIKNDRPIIFELKRPDQEVEFKWKNTKKAYYHHFKLAKDPEFKNIIVDKKIFASSTKINFPKTGTYYWKAAAKDKKGKNIPTRPVKVLIRPTPPPKKPKALPNLKLEVNHTLKTQRSLFSYLISSAHAASNKSIKLDWPAISNAKFYHIEIYTDKALKTKIKDIKVKNSFYHWSYQRVGKFYWRYRVEDYWGQLSPFSETSEIYLIKNKKEKIKKIKRPKEKIKTYVKKLNHFIDKIEDQNKKHIIYLGVSPSQINFGQKASSDFNINGNIMSGLSGEYIYRIDKTQHLSTSFQHLSGMVFEDQKFIYQKVDGLYHLPFMGSFVYAGISLISIATYQNINQEAKYKNNQLNSLITVGAKYLWQKPSILSYFKLSYATNLSYEFGLNYRFYSDNDYSLSAQFSYINQDLKVNESSIKNEQFQISIGPNLKF